MVFETHKVDMYIAPLRKTKEKNLTHTIFVIRSVHGFKIRNINKYHLFKLSLHFVLDI